MHRYPHNLLIYELKPARALWGIGLAWAHHRQLPEERTGSVEGTVEQNCDFIRDWGAAAVLSLTEFGIEKVTLPLEEFSKGVRERHMRWYHLPIRGGHAPLPAFEEGWREVGAELRALVRQGNRIVVHGEGKLGRSAMIVARLFVELGCDHRLLFQMLHQFRKGVFPGGDGGRKMIAHVYEQELIPDRGRSNSSAAIRDHAVGALLGLAVGDAIGTTLEFRPRDSYEHLTDMVGGGPFRLRRGEWTDDTAMALALADTLQHHEQFDDWALRQDLIAEANGRYLRGKKNSLARERLRKRIRQAEWGNYPGNPHAFERALMERFTAWMERGAYSCNGRCFDIGNTVRAALTRWKETGNPIAGSPDPLSAGNGSLMRLAPVSIRYWDDRVRLRDYAARQSRTTHGAPEAVDACVAFAEMLAEAIQGKPASAVFAAREEVKVPRGMVWPERTKSSIQAIRAGSWRGKPRPAIRSSGYVVDSLEAALWSVARSLTFEEAVLTAANLGGDADTTAAIAGQLAGAIYGASAIPPCWREKLAWHDRIVAYADALLPEKIREARFEDYPLAPRPTWRSDADAE